MTMKTIFRNMIDVPIIELVMSIMRSVEIYLWLTYSQIRFVEILRVVSRGRVGRGHLNSTNTRLPPSTHFVRPQPESTSRSRSQFYSSTMNHHRSNSLEIELEHTYASALTRYYGTRNGQAPNSSDYGDFRISNYVFFY